MNQKMRPLYETMTGRIVWGREGIRSNTPKPEPCVFVSHAPEPLPVLRYRNGRVYIDGEHDASRWFGLLRFENDRDDKVQLRLVDPRGDGSFPVELTPHAAFGFGRGEDLEERCFGVFLGVAENDVVNWAVAYDDPEHALRLSEQFLGVEPKTRMTHIEFDWYYGPTKTPEQVHDEYVRTLIALARCALRERQREPMKMSRDGRQARLHVLDDAPPPA